MFIYNYKRNEKFNCQFIICMTHLQQTDSFLYRVPSLGRIFLGRIFF